MKSKTGVTFPQSDRRLNPAKPETYTFLDRLFGETVASFPDQYFHVGGDDVSGADRPANPQVQDFMKANGLKTQEELSRTSSTACEGASVLMARQS